MPFDPSKDKVLKQWKCKETGLVVSINQYGDGEPKMQIGPRVLLKKRWIGKSAGQSRTAYHRRCNVAL